MREAIAEYKCYTDSSTMLFKRTSACLDDIFSSVDMTPEATSIPFKQLEEVERELQKSPSVFFIGESNCGKSSIINELLQQSSLPVEETPCTARIVRIKYSKDPYSRIVGLDGQERDKLCLLRSRKKLPKNHIVVCDEEREDQNALNAIVEIGLDHELLQSGIELIDSPGKSESEALDKILDEYLEKGTVPLFVYVINGCNNLRPQDQKTLKYLKDKCPQSDVMYVCNKVDVCDKARDHDNDDGDGDDSADEDAGKVQAINKGEKVFGQLIKNEYVSGDIESCPLFHAISAKKVREERRERTSTEFTENFKRFESSLKEHLGDVMKSQTRRVVLKLLNLQESFVKVVQVQKTRVTQQAGTLPDIIKRGREIDEKMLESLSKLTLSSGKSKAKIVESIKRLKEVFMHEAQEYKATKVRHLQREAHNMMKNLVLLENEPPSLSSHDLLMERFLFDIKESILEKTCNSLDNCVTEEMRELINELTAEIIQFNEDLADPVVSRILEESYDIQFLALKVETNELLGVVLNGLLDSMKEASRIALRKAISEPLSTSYIPTIDKKDIRKKEIRRSIVQCLLNTIDETRVAEAVQQACFFRLQKMHDLFQDAMNTLQTLQTSFAECTAASQLEKFRLHYTPRIRTLAVEGKALHDMQNLGPAALGSRIAKGRLGDIYTCTSERWCKASPNGQCVVKVVNMNQLGESTWNQTAVDLVSMRDMIQSIGGSHSNLLRIFGWVFHGPDVLHVVMERAERGLIAALREGLPEIIRMNVAVDVAEGLKAIHDANYIYNDLKPGNVLLMHDGTAKINLAKPEFPYELTPLGEPFHISPEMYSFHGKGCLSYPSYDIYAYGMLLWVLCEGSGYARPAMYENLSKEELQKAVERGVLPERTPGMMADACWELMMTCWLQRMTISIQWVVADVKELQKRLVSQSLQTI